MTASQATLLLIGCCEHLTMQLLKMQVFYGTGLDILTRFVCIPMKRVPIISGYQPLPRSSKLDLADYMPYLVNRLGVAFVARFMTDALVARGLGIAEWRVLAVLASSGSQRQTDLSQLTSIETSTLSRVVTRLIRAGLVSRSRNTRN